jgi:hypothetical protein
MPDPMRANQMREVAPGSAGSEAARFGGWTDRLVLFLRVIAGLAMVKGLYHWAVVCGFAGGSDGFLAMSTAAQTATVFFAIIDLVAAVGLWLAAPWGAVVWLTASVSMVVVDVFFPQVYGEQLTVVVVEGALIAAYLFLAVMAAREHPP